MPAKATRTPALPRSYHDGPGAKPGPRTLANAGSSEPSLHAASKKLVLDVFSGRLHPVTLAAISLGLDCLEPFDLDGNTAHDILDNEVFEALLRLCWSGIVVLIMLSPPCKEYSRRRKSGAQNPGACQEWLARLPSHTVRKPGSGNYGLHSPWPPDMNPEAGQPYRPHLLQALANSWGGPTAVLATRSTDRCCLSLATQPTMAGQKAGHGRATI